MHGDGARVHRKVQEGTGAERDNGAPGRWMVHGGSARVYAEGQGGDRAERDNGARGLCRAPGQSAITVHGHGVRVLKVQITVHGRAREGAGDGGSER